MTEDEVFEQTWQIPPGWWGKLTTVQNEPIGGRIIAVSFLLFLVAGLLALLMRIQLARPENNFLAPDTYNEFFSMHGSTMMYLVVIPFLEGVATLILPQMLGSRELPFPRLTSFTFWTFLFGSLIFYSSFLFGAVPDAGWTGYVPLSGPAYSPGWAMDFWLLGLSVAEVGALAGAMEIIIGVFKMRAPGMSLNRIPIFAWSVLVMGFMMLFAFTPLIVGSLLVELDRKAGTQFFNPAAGGDPVLWQHLFWIFGHPEVYIEFVPAMGIVAMIVPVFARRPLSGYNLVTLAMIATGFLSFGLWVHHMFTVELPPIGMMFFAVTSLVIAVPSGVQIVSFLVTFWRGRLVWKTPLLFVVGFIALFVLGGITGVMLGVVSFDWQVHDTFFIVAHFHYVLIGGSIFPMFAAIYYWFPNVTGRMLDERLGKWNFWLMFIGFNLAFFPLHIAGLLGMPRRVYTYPAGLGLEPYNLLATIGAFILGLGVAVLLWNVFVSWRHGEPVGADPWGGDTLEWSVSPSAPPYAFRLLPIVHSRHPLWEQASLHEGDERTKKLVEALGRWPNRWRAALVTSLFDGEPEEVFRVAGDSIWPFVTSVGVAIVFGATIFDLYLLTGAGVLLVVVGLIGWHWPDELQRNPEHEAIAAFEREHGIPVNITGSRAVARWTMGLTILALAVALATALFAYFYLQLKSSEGWPPPGIAPPPLPLALIAAGLLLLSSGALYSGLQQIRAGSQGGLRVGLGGAFLLGAAAAGVQLYDFSQLPFSAQTHAYGSAFYTLGGMGLLTLATALGMAAMVQVWAWRGYYNARHHLAISNLVAFWMFTLVGWLVLFGVIYLVPYLA